MVEAAAVVMADGMWFVNTSNLDAVACTARVAWETFVQHQGFVKPTMLTEHTSIYIREKTDFPPALSQGEKLTGTLMMSRVTTLGNLVFLCSLDYGPSLSSHAITYGFFFFTNA